MFRSFFTTIFRGSLFGVLVCWWSACEQADYQQTRIPKKDPLKMVIKKILKHVEVLYLQTRCLVFLSVGDLLVNKQITNRQEYQTRTPWTWSWKKDRKMYRFYTYKHVVWCSCLLVICLWTSRSPTDKNTKQGPPEDGREKRPKHVGVLYLQTRCLVFLSVGDLLVNKQITNRQEHQTRTPWRWSWKKDRSM